MNWKLCSMSVVVNGEAFFVRNSVQEQLLEHPELRAHFEREMRRALADQILQSLNVETRYWE